MQGVEGEGGEEAGRGEGENKGEEGGEFRERCERTP